jgi:hypothetical protein
MFGHQQVKKSGKDQTKDKKRYLKDFSKIEVGVQDL